MLQPMRQKHQWCQHQQRRDQQHSHHQGELRLRSGGNGVGDCPLSAVHIQKRMSSLQADGTRQRGTKTTSHPHEATQKKETFPSPEV